MAVVVAVPEFDHVAGLDGDRRGDTPLAEIVITPSAEPETGSRSSFARATPGPARASNRSADVATLSGRTRDIGKRASGEMGRSLV